MAHKTFISYKFSEAQALRDKILCSLGDDAVYYQGETANSPDQTDLATETIKNNLTDMMYDTTVTIVILSPNFMDSKWIDWEIEYCLKEISRKGRKSKTNGVVGVVQKDAGNYDWLVTTEVRADRCHTRRINNDKLYTIIHQNRHNLREWSYSCSICKSYDMLKDSYISIVDEEHFLEDPQQYIDNAFDKSENAEDFEIVKLR